jgi:DNA-binding CsgD family transcriptional regulator
VPRQVGELLAQLVGGPAGLVFEGVAGIGKTTAWADARRLAEAQGVRVLSARGAAAEAKLAFAALADLLAGVEPADFAALPALQQVALNRVLLRADDGPPTDQRVVAAAWLSLLEHLGSRSPVLVALDDLQWLDAPSRTVIAFAIRRLKGPVGVLGTLRTGDPDGADSSWLQLPHPVVIARASLTPMSLGALHAMIRDRLDRTLPRPLITQIHQISGGNPFFALELARTVDDPSVHRDVAMPGSLTSVVAHHLGALDAERAHVLLAAACTVDPTAAHLALVTEIGIQQMIDLLEDVETRGIVTFDGNRVRFAHPLLAHGMYTQATAAQRRAMHRRLAAVTDQPELRARHLALAAVGADDEALQALDAAADTAAARGSHSGAAELIDLAINLGGDTPVRRLRAAEFHFRAGALDTADERLGSIVDTIPAGILRAVALLLRGAIFGYRDGLVRAIDVLSAGIAEAGDIPALRLQGLLLLSLAVGLTGDLKTSLEHARAALADAEALGDAGLRSQALTLTTQVGFIYGLGTDMAALHTAMELEDPAGAAPATLQASAIEALHRAWIGDLHDARTKMIAVKRRCDQRGSDVDVVWASEHLVMIDVWLGRYDDATRTADDMRGLADQIGGHLTTITALTCQATVAAHAGRTEDTRLLVRAATEAANDSGLAFYTLSPTAALAFLEISLGDHEAALTTLRPVLDTFDPKHGTEIMVGSHLPDAIEALIATGQIDEAQQLVMALEDNGTRLDRPWMLGAGARGRAQILAARGDLDAAEEHALLAVDHHMKVPMPFEMARTQLLLGQIQHRRRRRVAASSSLTAALRTFEKLGSPLWAARADAQLQRLSSNSPAGKTSLTAAEQSVAKHAAAGLSNREIAAELFLSTKTVEMRLSTVYRKLGIRSRSQLFARLTAEPEAEGPS